MEFNKGEIVNDLMHLMHVVSELRKFAEIRDREYYEGRIRKIENEITELQIEKASLDNCTYNHMESE